MDTAQLLARPHDMSVGDAAPYLEGFATEMASVGYTTLTICGYLDSAIHFGGWLQAQGLSLISQEGPRRQYGKQVLSVGVFREADVACFCRAKFLKR